MTRPSAQERAALADEIERWAQKLHAPAYEASAFIVRWDALYDREKDAWRAAAKVLLGALAQAVQAAWDKAADDADALRQYDLAKMFRLRARPTASGAPEPAGEKG